MPLLQAPLLLLRWKHITSIVLLYVSSSFLLFATTTITTTNHYHVTALLSSYPTQHERIRQRQWQWQRDPFSFQWRLRVGGGPWNDNVNGDINNNNNSPQQQQPFVQAPMAAASLTPLKVMIFVDGTWLYYQIFERTSFRDIMSEKLGGTDWKTWFEIDWPKLPMVACQALLQDKKSSWSAIMAPTTNGSGVVQPAPQRPIEVMRVSVYSSMFRDTPEDSYRFQMFQNMRKAGFDVNMIETLGHKGAGEKCVDIQLAVDMLYYATVPDAYDVALLLTGDRDFLPAVVRCRQKGRRIGIVSMRSAASIAFEETPNLKDYDTIWLEDYIEQWTRKVDKPLPPPTNRPPKFTRSAAPPRTSDFTNTDAWKPSSKQKISDFILNKVLADYVSEVNSTLVSSRDVGRILKSTKVGDKETLKEIKERYGGLYQFLMLSDLFYVEGDSRSNVKAFWVGVVPEDERGAVNLDDPPDDLSEAEKAFLDEYANREKWSEAQYEFTLKDRDPTHDAESIDVSLVKPRDVINKHKSFNLDKCTVAQMREICRENNLPVSGKKIELLERIQNHFNVKVESDDTNMERVDPSTRLEMLVLEYVKAAGGEASSRDVGRYLAVNKASSDRLAKSKGERMVSALQEMKELHGGLLKFVEWSSLCTEGRELSFGVTTVVPVKDYESKLEAKIAAATVD